MTTWAAILACGILAGLALFQALLVAGAPIGRFAWGGAHEVLPRPMRIGSAISIVLYVVFALVILERAGITTLLPGDAFARVAIWVLAAYFLLGVVMNAISRSKPERYTMTPVALALAVLCVVIALG